MAAHATELRTRVWRDWAARNIARSFDYLLEFAALHSWRWYQHVNILSLFTVSELL